MGIELSEADFRRHAETALAALKNHLFAAENEGDFEVEEEGGVLHVLFEEPPAKFVITANAPVRQIWISALSTSFKLEWESARNTFVFPKTGEELIPHVDRLIGEQTGQ
jgi:CyaY protein